jgi:hypothetical protein
VKIDVRLPCAFLPLDNPKALAEPLESPRDRLASLAR